MKKRTCKICAAEIEPDKYHPYQKTCSQPCNATEQKNRQRLERQERRKPLERCASCGGTFVPSDGVWSVQKYCSDRCKRREDMRRYRAKNPERVLLASQKSKWGGNWFKAMERDQWTCQDCKTCNRKILMVHHLDGDGETGAKHHELSNLTVVCRPCHAIRHQHTTTVRLDGILYVRIGDKMLRVIEEEK